MRAVPKAGGLEQDDDLGSRWQIGLERGRMSGKKREWVKTMSGAGAHPKAATGTQDATALPALRLPCQVGGGRRRHENPGRAAVGQGESLRWRQHELHTAVGARSPRRASIRCEGSMPITLAANLPARGFEKRLVPQPTSTISCGANGTCAATRSSPPHDCRRVAARSIVGGGDRCLVVVHRAPALTLGFGYHKPRW